MKKISTLSEKRTSLTVYLMVIAVGIVTGAFLAKSPSLAGSCLVNQFFLVDTQEVSAVSLIVRTFSVSLLVVSAAFFFGASAVGQPFGIFLLIYRGTGIGISASAMYIYCGTAAILPVAVTILPKGIAFSVITALAVRENVHNSCLIFSRCFGRGEHETVKGGFKLILVKYAVLIILSLIISFADGGLYFLYTSVGGN
jgi:hypothetical protein